MRLPLGPRVAGAEGRDLEIRAALGGEGVQLGIIGKRGALVEAFCVELAQVPALIFGIDAASEEAWAESSRESQEERESLLDLLAKAEAERSATRCPKGHELTADNSYQKRPGVKGCRSCRREGNVWWRKRQRLEGVAR